MKKQKKHDIETETGIVPWIVAEGVIEAAEHLAGTHIPDVRRGGESIEGAQIPAEAIEHLVEYAEATYRASADFRRKIRTPRDRGRDQLYVFMEHWLAAYLKEHAPRVLKKLPRGYGWDYSPTVAANREWNARIRRARKRAR